MANNGIFPQPRVGFDEVTDHPARRSTIPGVMGIPNPVGPLHEVVRSIMP